MEGLLLGLVVAVVVHLIRNHYTKKEQEELVTDAVETGRKELAEKIANRKVREDLSEYDEEAFWEIVDDARKRSGENYKNHLGLLNDRFFKLSSEELIHLDNLLTRLFDERISYELQAATYIIFKAADLHAIYVLMTVFLLRGRVFFNQACLNPNLIIGKEVAEIDGRSIFDLTSDIYLRQTDELIPLPEEKEITFKGEKWTERELPSKFSELWMHFA
ncbi:MAG: DUF4240 domain-containing protein [Flavobacteriales bacterium]|nr:DUF4240 domain-containing protein [Flavobacteriales bacterium]